MARKIKVKLIMELREQGMSSRRMSMLSICEVFDITSKRGIGWNDVKDLSDDETYRLFYPDRHLHESAFEEPNWDYIHKEIARVGVKRFLSKRFTSVYI